MQTWNRILVSPIFKSAVCRIPSFGTAYDALTAKFRHSTRNPSFCTLHPSLFDRTPYRAVGLPVWQTIIATATHNTLYFLLLRFANTKNADSDVNPIDAMIMYGQIDC